MRADSEAVVDCGCAGCGRDCAGVNAPRSQKTSTNSASLSFAARGNHVFADDADILLGIVVVFGGNDVRSQQRRDHGSRPMLRGFANRSSDLISLRSSRP